MTLTTTIPVLCILLGLLTYGLAPNHRHLALVTFGCGLLVALTQVATKGFTSSEHSGESGLRLETSC